MAIGADGAAPSTSFDPMPSLSLPTRLRAVTATERVLAALIVAVVVAHAGVIAHRRATHAGDFDVSREFGRRLVAGEPLYEGGLHYPYMPTAALSFAPLALLPAPIAFAVRYLVALGCLWFVLHRLHALRRPALTSSRLVLAALTLVLGAHYILRDLDDGGPHLILLALLVAGIASVARGRGGVAATWFGLAAALKAPNALVLPFFLWKRQWRLAALTAVSIAAWTALPLLWMGPGSWWPHQRQWLTAAIASATGNPSGGARESEMRPQNQALRASVARLCSGSASVERAGGSPAPVGDRPAVEPARPHAALPALAALVVLAVVAWWSRRPWAGPDDPSWLAESSAVLVVSSLLSPATWVQHLVLMIPALYLIVAAARARAGLGAAATAAMALYVVLSLVLNRELLGRERYLVLLAHGLHTWCMLIVLAVLIAAVPVRRRAPG